VVVGARERFEGLYRAHAGAVRTYLRRRGVDSSAADDLVADVFLVVWRRLEDAPADPLPWTLGIARRVFANHRRGDARSVALRSRLVGEQLVSRRVDTSTIDRESAVTEALRSLSERDREVLLLVAWDGLEGRRAAAALGIGTRAFAMRLHRARHRFARALAAEDARPAERASTTEVM
jgi:RNA polymerase sigma-70 factor, ECF subfamily